MYKNYISKVVNIWIYILDNKKYELTKARMYKEIKIYILIESSIVERSKLNYWATKLHSLHPLKIGLFHFYPSF